MVAETLELAVAADTGATAARVGAMDVGCTTEGGLAAAIDGAGAVKQFRYVTWPGLRQTSIFILITITIAAFSLFTQVNIMTQGGPLNATEVLSTFSYKLSFTEYRFGLGATGAVILFLNLMIVGIFYLRLIRHEEVA